MPERRGVSARFAALLAVVVAAVLFAIVAAAAERSGETGRATAYGSSLRADESGHRAARLLLDELGMVSRSRRVARLPDGVGHVLVRVEGLPGAGPDEGPPQIELDAAGRELAEWVERGNAVLVLGANQVHGTGWPEIRSVLDLSVDPLVAGPQAAATGGNLQTLFGDRPDVPDDGGDVRERHDLPGLSDPWITPYYVVEPGAGDDVLVARGAAEDAAIVESRRAEGRVISVADPWFATNARIARGDNAAWLAALVDRLHGGGDVWFDDRALGQVATRGVLSILQEHGFGPALVAAFLLVLLVWWRVGPSDAPDRRIVDRQVYRPEAYADLRGDLYASCLTAQDVQRVVAFEIARRIGRSDAATPERALRLLAVREPERAAAIRDAVGGLPVSGVAPLARNERQWVRAVGQIWAALDAPATGSRTSDDSNEVEAEEDGRDG